MVGGSAKTRWAASQFRFWAQGGRIFYYAHLDHYAKNLNIGDFITPETVIGFVGTTGNAKGTPPHLHFGVYDSAGAIDPLTLLADLDDL